MDWASYDRQEDEEPFDALLKAKRDVGQDDRARYDQEKNVQGYLRMAKMNSDSAMCRPEQLRGFTSDNPAPDAGYCRARLDEGIGDLLRWHYYLALYFAEKGDWLAKAIPLILESAKRAGDGLRSTSYLMLAHNLNRWYNCKKDEAVLDAALRLARGRRGDRHAHWYVEVVGGLEKRREVRDEMRDLMLKAAVEAKPDMAYLYLEAAVSVAADKAPAKAEWVRMHEEYADRLQDPALKIMHYNDAKRHADDREGQRRINEKIKEAQRSIDLKGYTHTYEVPRQVIHGRNGFERVHYLVQKLRASIPNVDVARLQEEEMREKFPLQHLFARRIYVSDDGVPGPRPDASKAGDEADYVKHFANTIRNLRIYFSANVIEYEKDGRISEDSYADYLELIGLHTDAARRLIAEGIKAHCSANYAASIHILVPQVEHTLRLLLEQKGAKMLSGKNKVRQALLKPMIEEGADVVGRDLAEFLKVWLVDEGSINLRNRVCHALYGDYQGMRGYDPLHELDHGTSLLLVLVICMLASMSLVADSPHDAESRGKF